MNKTKKGFLTASAILNIISASLCIIFSLILLFMVPGINEQFIVAILKEDPDYTYIKHADGGYVFTFIEEGVTYEITDEILTTMMKTVKSMLIVASLFVLGISIALTILSVKLLKLTKKEQDKKGIIIANLVLTILCGNVVAMGLLIASLCIKNKKSDDNINELNQDKQQDVVLQDLE